MYMWSLFPWPGRTIGASLHCLNEQTLPSRLWFWRFKYCCFRVVSVVVERRHHRIFLLGRRWVILDWIVVMQMDSKYNCYLSQANIFLLHIVPKPHCWQRAEWGNLTHRTGAPAAHTLNFLLIYPRNKVAKGRLDVLEDFCPSWVWHAGWRIHLLMTLTCWRLQFVF